MAREQIQVSAAGATTYIKPKDLKAGATISGTYKGTFVDKYEKLNHKLEQSDGTMKVINGSGQLNALLAKVKLGSNVDVVYKGTSVISSGQFKGTKAHTFDVFLVTDEGKSSDAKGASNGFPF